MRQMIIYEKRKYLSSYVPYFVAPQRRKKSLYPYKFKDLERGLSLYLAI